MDVTVRWVQENVLALPCTAVPESQFHLIFDLQCFHALPSEIRPGLPKVIQRLLAPGGCALIITGSDLETRNLGPTRLSKQEIEDAFRGILELVHVHSTQFDPTPT